MSALESREVSSDASESPPFTEFPETREPPHLEIPQRHWLGSDSGYRDRPLREFRERCPDEYIEPWASSVRGEEFPRPERFTDTVNPKFGESPSYEVNCSDCARAVERTWRGNHETAAGRSIVTGSDGVPECKGEPPEQMEEWAGEPFTSVEVADIGERVEAAGPGASAIAISKFEYPDRVTGVHAYNVVNDGGEVKVIDGQSGEVLPWSDETGHPFLHDVSDPRQSGLRGRGRSLAMGWDAEGRSLW